MSYYKILSIVPVLSLLLKYFICITLLNFDFFICKLEVMFPPKTIAMKIELNEE